MYRFGHMESTVCLTCPDNEDTPKHVVFVGLRFRKVRNEMIVGGADNFGPETIDC